MGNVIYDNFILANEVEDQYNSHLDLQQFFTVDNSLVGVPGMVKKINVYRATNGTQKLTMGQGNTQTIEVGFSSKEYRIQLAQNRFKYYDEEAMTDPMIVPVGARHMGTDMFNTVNADVFEELNKAPMIVLASAIGFDQFADAQAMFNLESLEGVNFFGFVHPSDVANLRKALKDSLQYVEAFVRSGYVGTVAGTNLYTKKDAVPGTIVTATREAVTVFNKKGVEVEQTPRSQEEANIRANWIFSRKYYLAALTDETKAVKIVKGSAAATSDTTASASKTYYEKTGNGYVAVTPETGDNPATKGWYEITIA